MYSYRSLIIINLHWFFLGQIIFFGLFTPMSLLMKLFRRDELRLKLVADRKSHWKERDIGDAQTNTFKHQF